MREWYMENDSRTFVDRDADIAYDTDNDAWVELGSTEGSTPVWWRSRTRGSGSSASNNKKRQMSEAEKLEREKYFSTLERLKKTEERKAELESKPSTGFSGTVLYITFQYLLA